jgi:hypothetical protein
VEVVQGPREINDADMKLMVAHFVVESALDVVWWACRYHDITRVADAFELPLEREHGRCTW